jgi:hypothetical protein
VRHKHKEQQSQRKECGSKKRSLTHADHLCPHSSGGQRSHRQQCKDTHAKSNHTLRVEHKFSEILMNFSVSLVQAKRKIYCSTPKGGTHIHPAV